MQSVCTDSGSRLGLLFPLRITVAIITITLIRNTLTVVNATNTGTTITNTTVGS